jgi:uncharacterized protein with PQ loop repeat
MFEMLGAAGIAISALAYLPQVIHLAKEHCSAGISGRAWAMWLTSSMLVGALAVHRKDIVFIILQLSTLTSASIIVFLAHRYRGMVCELHAHSPPTARPKTIRDRKKQAPDPLIWSRVWYEPISKRSAQRHSGTANLVRAERRMLG